MKDKRIKIIAVCGTRPEAIKMSPLIKEFQKFPNKFELKVCVTGQHREMLYNVLKLFDINADFDLNIMKPDQDLYDITSNVLLKIKFILKEVKPDIVLVQGDTTTAMAATLASFYERIPVGHIEAGLRTNNIYSPWPEEINRQIISRIATYHFAPTELSKSNLIKDGIEEKKILVSGNTGIDALFSIIYKIKKDHSLQTFLENIIFKTGYKFSENKIILITGHRRENIGNGFINICNALKRIATKNKNVDIVYPLHLNPNVRNTVIKLLSDTENIFLIEPLNYEAFVYLIEKSYIIITDSGGIQEEAPSLGKPVLVIRDTTERPEAIQAKTVKLVGTDEDKIINETNLLLNNEKHYSYMSKVINPYGDGNASIRIVEFLTLKYKH